MKRTDKTKLSTQMKKRCNRKVKAQKEYDGNDVFISTGSTLLDLAISGGRNPQGGIPGGILVEVFGPSGSGKTVLLCEIAGAIQRLGGDIMFHDPEARLNKQFARMFDMDTDHIAYTTPNTVTEVFQSVRAWEPKAGGMHGILADSLAALSTELEMGDDGDKMGMRRAKEFSEECRKTCRILTNKGYLMVCSNQIRQNPNAGPYGQRYRTPGGEAIPFYSSLRLRTSTPTKIKSGEKNIGGKKQTRIIGIETEVEVYKSSVWKPYRTAPLYIVFDYGIDDIRGNLRYLKTTRKDTTYIVDGQSLGQDLSKAIAVVEEDGLEPDLKQEVIELWHEVEAKFIVERKPKTR